MQKKAQVSPVITDISCQEQADAIHHQLSEKLLKAYGTGLAERCYPNGSPPYHYLSMVSCSTSACMSMMRALALRYGWL